MAGCCVQALILLWIVLGAEWIGGADSCPAQCLREQSLQILRFTQLYQPPQGAIGVGCGGVDDETGLVAVSVTMASVSDFGV